MVELDGKFSNRAKGEDKPDKAGTAYPDNEVYRGVCSNHICETCIDITEEKKAHKRTEIKYGQYGYYVLIGFGSIV